MSNDNLTGRRHAVKSEDSSSMLKFGQRVAVATAVAGVVTSVSAMPAMAQPTTESQGPVNSVTDSNPRAGSVDSTAVDMEDVDLSDLELGDNADLVEAAYKGIGSGYVYGGTQYGAWDCSGFTQWVYRQSGVEIPRTTWAQADALTPTTNPQPGDLVMQNGGSHVGIYVGNGMMISALNAQQGTLLHSVDAMPVSGFYTAR